MNDPDAGQADRVDQAQLELLVAGEHGAPHDVLGPHVGDTGVLVRVLKPMAESVVVLHGDGERTPLDHVHGGVWAGALDGTEVPDYRLEVTYPGGEAQMLDDPYRYLPTLGETDLHLINEGRHEQLWEVLGAHVQHYDVPGSEAVQGGITGTSFSVWAPRARGVRLKGDLNSWDGREHPMRQLGTSGVWELFVPGVASGTRYKFGVLGADGQWRDKADPMAFHTEVPPLTSSVVFESSYTWGDEAWMEARSRGNAVDKAMSVYEVHLGSWKKHLDGSVYGYQLLGEQLAAYCSDLGFTHIEFLPVMEHPFGGSWGYQVTSYFAPTARFGDPDGFRRLVDVLHQHGIGVILDWVPAHFPKDEFALARFDGTPLYEDPNPSRGEHPDWGTYVFDFGRREVRNFLVANALYWLEDFHADGIRVDAVASMLYLDYSREPGEWTPNVHGGRENLEAKQFLQEMNATVYRRGAGSDHRRGGVDVVARRDPPDRLRRPGLRFKWNMGWMHDSLGYVQREPAHRSWHHGELTSPWSTPTPRTTCSRSATTRSCTARARCCARCRATAGQQLATCAPTSPSCGPTPASSCCSWASEFGQESEWAEARELDWWLLEHPEHLGMQSLVRDLNARYAEAPALWQSDNDPAGFRWLDANDANHNVFSFLRTSDGADPVVCVVNFAAVPHHGYRLGLPSAGRWREVLNTDAEVYTGSGVGNYGAIETEGRAMARPAGLGRDQRAPARRGLVHAVSGSTVDLSVAARAADGSQQALRLPRDPGRRRSPRHHGPASSPSTRSSGSTPRPGRTADRLASLGYLTLATDLFSDAARAAAWSAPCRPWSPARASPTPTSRPRATGLREHSGCSGKVGVIGFCMGGGFALMTLPDWTIAAPNYGTLPSKLDERLEGACPVVASYGGRDLSLRGAAAKLETALESAGVQHDVKEYPAAGHSFLNEHANRPAVGPPPDQRADARRPRARLRPPMPGPASRATSRPTCAGPGSSAHAQAPTGHFGALQRADRALLHSAREPARASLG